MQTIRSAGKQIDELTSVEMSFALQPKMWLCGEGLGFINALQSFVAIPQDPARRAGWLCRRRVMRGTAQSLTTLKSGCEAFCSRCFSTRHCYCASGSQSHMVPKRMMKLKFGKRKKKKIKIDHKLLLKSAQLGLEYTQRKTASARLGREEQRSSSAEETR